MTKRRDEILEAIDRGQTSEGNKDVHDPAEGERCDAFVQELQRLQGYGWIELPLRKELHDAPGRVVRSRLHAHAGRPSCAGRVVG